MNEMRISNAGVVDYPHTRRVLSSKTLTGDAVVNQGGESLGTIDDLMIDLASGRIAYAVLSFGGFLGMGDKLFAVPWNALAVDQLNRRFVLNVAQETLKQAPGFPKDRWPDMTDPDWGSQVHEFYSVPYER